jgi:DENN domain-containing protein 11
MAATRRGQGQIRVELPKNVPLTPDLPPLSALFLIYFDTKAGYTIGWRRTLPGIGLEGVVEYKSLPSGLHTVNEDLIYFVHDRYAGLSAFANAPASEESRNVRMIAVGVLVPLSYGRLGRSWKYADKLKEMAQ